MKNEIKKAISKAMAKLVGLSLNKEIICSGHYVKIEFDQDTACIWLKDKDFGIDGFWIVSQPKNSEGIKRYSAEIEKAMAELKVKLHQVEEVLATLNTEVNE